MLLAIKLAILVIKILLAVLVIFLIVMTYRTFKASHDPRAKVFAAGHVPATLPDGFYSGTVNGYNGGWKGKSFDAATKTGSNTFDDNQAYPFTFYTGSGLSDKNLTVIKIDYNNSQNPFWLHGVVDEIVETDTPNHFLGKIHLRFLGLTFAVGYFTLQK